jgi:hypothetical protein
MSAARLPDLEAVLERVNLETVAEEMGKDKELAEFEFVEAKKLVIKACGAWLPRDVVEFEVEGIEERVEEPFDGVTQKGFLDLRGKFRGEINATKKLKGKSFVLDWKTAGRKLDSVWRDRLIDSWQWRMYHELKPMDVFIYRGINRQGDVREVIMPIENGNVVSLMTINQLRHDIVQLGEYFDKEAEVWSRHMPWSCRSMGECEFIEECLNDTMPRGCPEEFPNISYTLINNLHSCPEKTRRLLIQKERGIEERRNESLRLGSAVHRGLAEVYSQVFGVEYEKETVEDEADAICE